MGRLAVFYQGAKGNDQKGREIRNRYTAQDAQQTPPKSGFKHQYDTADQCAHSFDPKENMTPILEFLTGIFKRNALSFL